MHERGEAEVYSAGGHMHPAEGQVGGLPHFHSEVVGGKHGSPDMVGADEEDLAALDDRDYVHLHPHILPNERRTLGHAVVFILGDPVALHVMYGMDHLPGPGQLAQHLLAERVVFVVRLHDAIDREGGHAARGVIAVAAVTTA